MFGNTQWYLQELGETRLLKLATLLERVDTDNTLPSPSYGTRYSQYDFYHPCGTPSCALGWWTYFHPERWTTELSIPRLKGYIFAPNSQECEFQLNYLDAEVLFSRNGCAGARSGGEAAIFIRKFVAKRRLGGVLYVSE